MKLTYFVNLYPAVSHTFIKREILALEQLGYDVQRVSIRAAPALVDEGDRAEAKRTLVLNRIARPRILGMLLRRCGRRPLIALRTLLWALGLAGRTGHPRSKMLAYYVEAALLAELANAHGSELVRVHFGTNGAIVARIARRLGGPPFAIAYHGPDDFDSASRWDICGTLAESTFVTAITSYCRAMIMRWSDPADWPRIHIIHCGVDPAFLASAPPFPAGAMRRLCIVARLSSAKGLSLLLDALALARDRGCPLGLDIVGDGPERTALERRVRDHGLGDAVTFHGPLSGEGVRRVIAGAHAMVLASFAEGLPVVIMEAMAMGRPAIATAITGVPELVRPGDNGWLIPAGDVEALADALLVFAATPEDRLAEMGGNARAAVESGHRAETEAARLHQVMAASKSR